MSEIVFSVDLEDVRDWVKNGTTYKERVPANTERYLSFLQKHKSKATFFTVGNVAKKYPELIREIISQGHEIACHSNAHIQLNKMNPQEFKDDLQRNCEALRAAGANQINGYRAPTFSLTEKTQWAYQILTELNFTYSSSVLPAANPLYGWQSFGKENKKINPVLWELPITLHPWLNVPLAGGVYFRLLPLFILRNAVKHLFDKNNSLLTYFHPYDIDNEQEKFMHPDLNNNVLLNRLMYINRSRLLPRLENLIEETGARIISYQDLVSNLNRKEKS